MNSNEMKTALMATDDFGDKGFNEGAANWLIERIENGEENFEQAMFRRMNYRRFAQVNAEYADYSPSATLPTGVEVMFVGSQPDNMADAYSVRQNGVEVARIAGKPAAMAHAATLTNGWAIPGGGSVAAIQVQRAVGDTMIDQAYQLLYENMRPAANRHDAALFIVHTLHTTPQSQEQLAALAVHVGASVEVIEEVYRTAVLSKA